VHPGPGYKRVAPCFNARNARTFYILLRWSSAALPGFASGRSGSATSAFQGSNRSHPVAPCAAGSSARNHSAASTHRDVRRLAVSALNGRSLDRRSQSCDVIACGGAGLAGLLGAVLRNQNSRRPKERSDNNAASTRALSAHRQIFRVMTPLATSLVALFHIRPGLRCRPLARNGHGAMSAVSPPSESGNWILGPSGLLLSLRAYSPWFFGLRWRSRCNSIDRSSVSSMGSPAAFASRTRYTGEPLA